MKRLAHALLLLACLACGGAQAGGLQVTPTLLDVPATQQAAGLWLSNVGDAPLQAQARVYRWTQEGGTDRLETTREMLASPPMLSVAPEARQLVRAVRLGAPPTQGVEQAYRIVIDELPLQKAEAKGLQFVLRYSVPVFVQPAGAPATAPALHWSLVRAHGQLWLHVRNSGGSHAQLADVQWQAAGAPPTVVHAGLLGYVLPGASMRWPLRPQASVPADGAQWEALVNGQVEKVPLEPPADPSR
ncbi:MAG: molecular chaperone [Pseudomonadota bacterium]|nr:molecular chaperone [Pseudomonadota bacterium]